MLVGIPGKIPKGKSLPKEKSKLSCLGNGRSRKLKFFVKLVFRFVKIF